MWRTSWRHSWTMKNKSLNCQFPQCGECGHSAWWRHSRTMWNISINCQFPQYGECGHSAWWRHSRTIWNISINCQFAQCRECGHSAWWRHSRTIWNISLNCQFSSSMLDMHQPPEMMWVIMVLLVLSGDTSRSPHHVSGDWNIPTGKVQTKWHMLGLFQVG